MTIARMVNGQRGYVLIEGLLTLPDHLVRTWFCWGLLHWWIWVSFVFVFWLPLAIDFFPFCLTFLSLPPVSLICKKTQTIVLSLLIEWTYSKISQRWLSVADIFSCIWSVEPRNVTIMSPENIKLAIIFHVLNRFLWAIRITIMIS